MTALHLDLRHLPAPEPMERIVDALRLLPPGWILTALTPFRPLPLLPLLDEDGFAWCVHDLAAGGTRVAICHLADRHLLDLPERG